MLLIIIINIEKEAGLLIENCLDLRWRFALYKFMFNALVSKPQRPLLSHLKVNLIVLLI